MKSPPASRRELDEVIVNIELTLASIVQGVALTFLAENASEVVAHGPVTAWPYVAVSFLIILLFWARAVGSSRVDLQACKLEYSIVSPK